MYRRDSSNALNVFDRLVFNAFGGATPPDPGMRPASAQLISREVLPFYASLAALAAGTLLIDAVLHLLDVVWIGRYLGIAGTLIIIGSFGYSLRKRKLITAGNPVTLLRTHERMAWFGSLLVLVHAGLHFNALLGWLAVGAMLINVASGLTGKYLLRRARSRLDAARERLRSEGLSDEALDERLYWDSLTVDTVKRWRALHRPITLAFGVLALAHIISISVFWGWK